MQIRMGIKGWSRAAATPKMECFVIIVNSWKPLTIITKRSILDVAAALDPPLRIFREFDFNTNKVGLFEGSFFLGGQSDLHSYLKKN